MQTHTHTRINTHTQIKVPWDVASSPEPPQITVPVLGSLSLPHTNRLGSQQSAVARLAEAERAPGRFSRGVHVWLCAVVVHLCANSKQWFRSFEIARWRAGVLKAAGSSRQLFGRMRESSKSQGESHLVPNASETPEAFFRWCKTERRLGCPDLHSEILLVHLDETLPKNIFGGFKIPEATGFPIRLWAHQLFQ